MPRHTKINIPSRQTNGMYLIYDHTEPIKDITNVKDVRITSNYKLVLRLKVNGHVSKKTFDFDRYKTLSKAIDIVNDQRLSLRERLKTTGSLRDDKPLRVEVKTVGSEWKLYIDERAIELRSGTIGMYQCRYDQYLSHLANRDITTLTRDDMQAIIVKLVKSGLKHATVTQIMAIFRAFFKRRKVLSTLEWDDLSMPNKVSNKRTYDHSLETTKKIVSVMRNYQQPEIRAIFLFLLRGRRINEVITLRHDQVDWDTMTYTIEAEYSKNKRALQFELDEELAQIVRERLSVQHGELTQHIFGLSVGWVRQSFYKLLRDNKLPKLHLHDIRHMVASTAIQNGVALADVSRALGHSSIQVTESRYVTKDKQMASRATSAFINLTR